MLRTESDTFTPEVAEQLKFYVYRLIDPRNGETFYVGKGKGNRVFAHARLSGDLAGEPNDNKAKRIRQIQLSGFKVAHIIHRHGMNEKTAFEVEAALIDVYSGLTNLVSGTYTNDYGVMHAKEIIHRYSVDTAEFAHKAILINVSKSAEERSLYDATRFAWKISISRAIEAEIILPIIQGLIVGAFVADEWLEASTSNFPGRDGIEGRYGFVGQEASPKIINSYVDKRIPDKYRKKGASNPIKYTW